MLIIMDRILINLLDKIFQLDLELRISFKDMKKHPFFRDIYYKMGL